MTIQNWLSKLNRRDTRLFPKLTNIKKIVLILVISVCLVSFSTKIFAQNPITALSIIGQNKAAVLEGGNQEAWLDHAMISNIISFARLLSGDLPDPTIGDASKYVPGGAIGTVNSLIGSAYNPPASGIEYIARMKDNILGKPAYAQGVGFNSLAPLLPLWTGFRNAVYILSSLIFIIIGIMIMLRAKISPQAVISIQNAIPQLITTLILVTFSYAIAGLLIDFMNFFQAAVLIILFNTRNSLQDSIVNNPNFPTEIGYFIQNIGNFISGANWTRPFSFDDLSNHNNLFQTMALINQAIPWAVVISLSAAIGLIIALIFAAPTVGGSLLLIAAGPIIIVIIIEIIILVNIIRLLFGLVRAYINVIIRIILAPLEIGAGAFPNSQMGFNSWLMGMVAHLAVFPGVLLFLVLLNIIVDRLTPGINAGQMLWSPPLLNGFLNVPVLGATTTGSVLGAKIDTTYMVSALVGIGGLMLVAKLPDMIPQFVFNLKPSPWGTAIGQSMDLSKNPLYNTARGAVKNYTGSQIKAGAGGRYPSVGRVIENAANIIDPNNPQGVQDAAGDAVIKS